MDNDWIFDDPMDEIYAIRAKISAHYGHDPNLYFAAMLEKHKDDEAKGIKYAHLPIARVHEPFEYPPVPDDSPLPCACESPD